MFDDQVVETIDFSFEPVVTGRQRCLSKAQVEHYNREGFVQPFDILADNEVVETRHYVDRLMAARGEDGAYGINCYQARLAGLWDIATDARILDHVEDIIGPDIICWASAILSKRPHDPNQVPWHQDASFWHLTPTRTVTVWLAIDDADDANSAMRFVPRTHNRGRIAERTTSDDAVFHKGIAAPGDWGTPFTNVLEAGQMSLHADMLVHGSLANLSDRRRCGLTLRYCPPTVRAIDERWSRGIEAIICRGNDVSGHWTHHPRPSSDDIGNIASPHVVGNN